MWCYPLHNESLHLVLVGIKSDFFQLFWLVYNIHLPWLNSNMVLVLLRFQLLLNMRHPSPWQLVIFYRLSLIRRPLQHPDRTEIKWKTEIYNTVETVLTSNPKIVERGKIFTLSTQIHDGALSCLIHALQLKWLD